MFCDYVFRIDYSYTYSYMDRFKHYDLIRHKVYATTTKQRGGKMKINEWGVFVERPDTSTYEIRLSDELATKVYKYIEKLKEDDENILSGDTKGKILW